MAKNRLEFSSHVPIGSVVVTQSRVEILLKFHLHSVRKCHLRDLCLL